MVVNPTVDAFLVGQEEVAVCRDAQERTILRSEIRAVGLDDGGAAADCGVQAFKVLNGHLSLPLEHGFEIIRA